MARPLENAISFLRDFGLFDIVLPFLLVFSLVFAVLEKTRILGLEKNEKGVDIPKKNLNAMVSFVFALIVVATNKIISTINKALPNVVLLLVIFVAFLLLIGIFATTGELDFKKTYPGYFKFFTFSSLVAIILIFLGAIQTGSGQSWLEYAWNYAINNFEGAVVSSIIFLIVIIASIAWITKPNDKSSKSSSGGG